MEQPYSPWRAGNCSLCGQRVAKFDENKLFDFDSQDSSDYHVCKDQGLMFKKILSMLDKQERGFDDKFRNYYARSVLGR